MHSQDTKKQGTLGLVVRVSRVGKREGSERFQSPVDQIAIGTARAEREGYGVRVFKADAEKNGISGSTPYDDRPGMGEALRLVEVGQLAGIVVSALDRLVREDNGVTLRDLQKRIRELGGVLLVGDNAMAEILDPDDEPLEGNEEWGVEGPNLANAIYRRQARKVWRRARKNAIDRGVCTSSPPAGYNVSQVKNARGELESGKLVPNGHAPAMLAAFEARAKGASWTEVARLLTSLGVPTRADRRSGERLIGPLRPWAFKSAAVALANPVYLGRLKSGKFANEDAHDPIVSAALWRRVRARDAKPGSWSATKREPAMLAKVLRCASCGGALSRDSSVKPSGARYEHYRCRSTACPSRTTISLKVVEEYVSAWAIEAMQVTIHRGPKHGKNRDAKRAALEVAVAAAESELETFVTATSAADIGAELFAKGLAQRKQARDEAVTALQAIEDDDADAFPGLPPELLKGARRARMAGGMWEAMGVEQQNRTLRRHFPNGIPVKRGKGVEERIGDLDDYCLKEEVAA